MMDDRLGLARNTLEQLLRERLRSFEGFERNGATSMEHLGIDPENMGQLLPTIGRVLRIALPDHDRHKGILQTPNTLLAFVSAAVLESAWGMWHDGSEPR